MPARGKGGGAQRRGAPPSQRDENVASKDPPPKRTRDATPQETTPNDGNVEQGTPSTAPPPASAPGTPNAGNVGQGTSGKDGTAIGEWSKGTSDNERDHKPPTSIETPDHLAIICPPATQQLIWDGAYVNLACFIPKEEGEELTTRLEWTDGSLKQHTIPRQIKTIFDWTSAFIRFMGVYLQYHPGNP